MANSTPSGTKAPDSGDAVTALIKAFVHTDAFRHILIALLPEVLDLWASGSRLKQFFAGPLSKHLARSFAKSEGADRDKNPLEILLADPRFIQDLSEELPALIEGLMEMLSTLSQSLLTIPVDERTKLLKNIIEQLPLEEPGRMISRLGQMISEIHETDPTFLTETARTKTRELIHHIDFGQIKETIDKAEEDIVATVQMVNEELWQYPAKVVCLMAVFPSLANIALQALTKTMVPMNDMAPDLLADVVCALLREIKGEKVGSLINETTELIRKLHTGNVLIGEPGRPQLHEELEKLAVHALAEIDLPLLLKSRELLFEFKETFDKMLLEVSIQNPELAKAFFQHPFRSLAGKSRAWARRADICEQLFTDADLAEQFSLGWAELSGEELAEIINRFCTLLNRAYDGSQSATGNLPSRILDSLDVYEVGETAQRLSRDLVEGLKPLAPDIMPPLLKGVAELITAADQSDEDALGDAMASLRKAFNGKEAQL